MTQRCWRSYVCHRAEEKHSTATQLEMVSCSERRWLRQGSKHCYGSQKDTEQSQLISAVSIWLLLVGIHKNHAASLRGPHLIVVKSRVWHQWGKKPGDACAQSRRVTGDPSAEGTGVVSSRLSLPHSITDVVFRWGGNFNPAAFQNTFCY